MPETLFRTGKNRLIQAAILAGGLGTRMRPFTDTVPKPMLPVLGRPFLEHQLELLRANGITRFLLLVSYLGGAIQDYFTHHSNAGAKITFSHERTPFGTGGALRNAFDLLDDEFLVINGDTLLDIDYSDLVTHFRARGTQATIAAYRNTSGPTQSNLAVETDGLVLAYEKRFSIGGFVDAGVIAVKKAVLNAIPEGVKCSFEQEVFPKLIAAQQLNAWTTNKPFFDIGTPAGLQLLEEHLLRAEGRRS